MTNSAKSPAVQAFVSNVLTALKAYPETWTLTPVKGKVPYQREWTKGTSRQTIAQHIKTGKADGVGIITGTLSGGIVAIDCDGSTAQAWASEKGYPETVSFTSGKPGRCQILLTIPKQYWEGLAKRKVITTSEGEQLEIRWDNHQSVLPPSAHPETEGYRWINSPETCPIGEAPLWVIEALLDEPKPETPKPKPRVLDVPNVLDVFPLAICLSKASRNLLKDGAGEGTRNDRGAALARDLIGTANRLDQLRHRYDGEPRGMFDDFCDRCTPPIAQRERENIWKSAEKSNPGATLSDEAIENCLKAWEKKNTTTGAEPVTTTPATPTQDPEYKRAMLAARLEKVQAVVGNRLRLNTLNKKIEFDGESLDSESLQVTLALEDNLSIPDAHAGKIFKYIAEKHAYNPVVDYLKEVSQKYGNDTTILKGFAQRYFGQDEAIYDNYIKRFLISAVARVIQPGCKVDSALFLQGDQGTFKSTFFKVLASEPWFDDSMGAASDKDERLKLHTVWMVEWAELETMFKRKDISAVKSFLTTTKDLIRPPYGRDTREFKRQCVIVGTTNEDVFLKDPTGSRRFWVIPVQKPIPIDLLEQERDRIWAAAYALYKAGEQWHLTREESQQQAILNEYFQEVDPWQEYVWDYIKDRIKVSTREILETCIKKELREQDKKDQQRIASCLKALGWEQTTQGKDALGNRARLYTKKISFLTQSDVQVVQANPNSLLGKDYSPAQPLHNPAQPPLEVVQPSLSQPAQPCTTQNDEDVQTSKPCTESNTAIPAQPAQPFEQDLKYFSDQEVGGVHPDPAKSATPATPCNTSKEGGVAPSKPCTEGLTDEGATPATPFEQDLKYFSDQADPLAPIPVDPNEEYEVW